ncbi:hypothetical protein HPDFL43_16416 [Hoeflea phototrophica DFL-43]|uniref:Uncharacterized protein n=2 Tax=Hoeflea TaxID=274591 RepID=A9D7H2_HOEPD|nr:hypothetical protein HPDFL43_16416 [Hoeflea phototrophica DFL-43]
MRGIMAIKNSLRAVALALAICISAAPNSHASSFGIQWVYFSSSDGARISAIWTASFLGSDEVTRRHVFSALCNPQQPTPYVTALIDPRGGSPLHPSQNLKIRLEDGNHIFVAGDIDRIASANAGDNLPRYSFFLPATSPFFRALTNDGSRFYPKIDSDPGDGGTRLVINNSDRQKLRDFLNHCASFAGTTANTAQEPAQQPERPHACRDFLNGPNSYAGNSVRIHAPEIVDAVCGNLRMDVRPAVCMHIVTSGNVAWNQTGASQWEDANAASLCYQSQNPGLRIDCFLREVKRGNEWYVAVNICNQVN